MKTLRWLRRRHRRVGVRVDDLAGLTALERRLVRAARAGDCVVCGALSVDALGSADDPRYVVRSDLIRKLLLGHHGSLDPRGVRLTRAHVTGTLDLDNLRTPIPLRLRECAIDEPIQLADARLPLLDLSGSRVVSIHANGLRIESSLLLRGLRGRCDDERGTLLLEGARIDRMLDLKRAQLENTSGVALRANRLRVGENLVLRDGFRATGAGTRGTVRFFAATIGGQLDMEDAQLSNTTSAALVISRIEVHGGLFLDGRFHASGVGEGGAVWMTAAHIGARMTMENAHITNESGPALRGDNMLVDGDLRLNGRFHATGHGDHGAVRLVAARISGDLDLTEAQLENPHGPLLNVDRATVTGAMRLAPATICPSATTTSSLCSHMTRRIDIDQFTFGSLGSSTWRHWLHLIQRHTATYRPTPYQHLAAMERAAGHDGNARRILIAQQRDLHARGALGGHTARLAHSLWGLLAGYGYRARRTALALILALTLAGALGWWAGHWTISPGHHAAERTLTSGSPPGTPCSPVEQIGLGIDRGLPLIPLGIRTHCDLDTATTAGQWFTVSIWLLQALVWALATLALAGYTALIRKPT